jgi:hypothetical protein
MEYAYSFGRGHQLTKNPATVLLSDTIIQSAARLFAGGGGGYTDY